MLKRSAPVDPRTALDADASRKSRPTPLPRLSRAAGTGRLVRAYLPLAEATLKRISYTAVDRDGDARRRLEAHAAEKKCEKFGAFNLSDAEAFATYAKAY
jgi:hypothetical protein